MNLLTSNDISLVGHLGGDLSVVNSARVSLGKHHAQIEEGDAELIRFLMTNRHGSPFEHNLFTFRVSAPIFVAREWFRHRIGSFNEFSTRYTEMPEECYLPDLADMRTQVGKPGAYRFESMAEDRAEDARDIMDTAYTRAFDSYHGLLRMGVAREVARNVLPLGALTEFYWTVNARSLMNFLSLRNSPHALREIRYYAERVEEAFEVVMPHTAAAFLANGRIAP